MPQLEGFSLTQFRSFGEIPQYVAPLTKVNLLAGQNNSGKSNILRFAQQVLGSLDGRPSGQVTLASFQGYDVPVGSSGRKPTLGLAIGAERALATIREIAGRPLEDNAISSLIAVLSSPAFRRRTMISFGFSMTSSPRKSFEDRIVLSNDQCTSATSNLSDNVRNGLASASEVLAQSRGGGQAADLMRVIEKALDLVRTVPKVQTVDAFRQIRPGDDSQAKYSGQGLIEAFARLQFPDAADVGDRRRFDSSPDLFNAFSRTSRPPSGYPITDRQLTSTWGGRLLPLDNSSGQASIRSLSSRPPRRCWRTTWSAWRSRKNPPAPATPT